MQTAHGRRPYASGIGLQIDFVCQPAWLLDNSGAIVVAADGERSCDGTATWRLPLMWARQPASAGHLLRRCGSQPESEIVGARRPFT
jgi:hypothetical protein